MKDLHFDGAFASEFNQASKNWSWATWHQAAAMEHATVMRLLSQAFSDAPEEPVTDADNTSDCID